VNEEEEEEEDGEKENDIDIAMTKSFGGGEIATVLKHSNSGTRNCYFYVFSIKLLAQNLMLLRSGNPVVKTVNKSTLVSCCVFSNSLFTKIAMCKVRVDIKIPA
jgi:hypothetical protein